MILSLVTYCLKLLQETNIKRRSPARTACIASVFSNVYIATRAHWSNIYILLLRVIDSKAVLWLKL